MTSSSLSPTSEREDRETRRPAAEEGGARYRAASNRRPWVLAIRTGAHGGLLADSQGLESGQPNDVADVRNRAWKVPGAAMKCRVATGPPG